MADTVRVFFEAFRQFRHLSGQLIRPFLDLSCALIDLIDAVRILFDAVRQISGAVRELIGAVRRFIDPVRELAGAVRQVVSILLKVLHLAVHVAQETLVILIQLLIIFKKSGEDHGHAGAHLEVLRVHRDLNGIRNIQIFQFVFRSLTCFCLIKKMFRTVFGSLQAVGKAREGHAYDHGVFPFGNDGAVVHLNVFDIVIGEDDARHGRERDIDILVLLCVFVLDPDLDLTGLAGQFLRRHLLPFQVIGDLLKDRRLFVRGSLIIDIIAVRVPGQ